MGTLVDVSVAKTDLRRRRVMEGPMPHASHDIPTGCAVRQAAAHRIRTASMVRLVSLALLATALTLLLIPAAAQAATGSDKYAVTINLSKSKIFVNDTVKFSGTVRTAAGKPASGTVTIQKRYASGGSWVNWRTDKLNSSGVYSKSVKMTNRQTWSFRARMQGNSNNGTGYSSMRGLQVKGPTSTEAKVISLVNKERSKRGLKPVRAKYSLTCAARAHSSEMARRGKLTHTSANGASVGQRLRGHGYTRSGYRYWGVGENIARATKGSLCATPEGVVASWMRSSAHRNVILKSNFRDVGVGIRTSSSGRCYFTLDPGRRIR